MEWPTASCVGDLGQFLARRGFQLLGGHADGRTQGEAGLGGVGEDACQFGELVDEPLDAFLALPVEEGDGRPEAEQAGDRAEEGGEDDMGEDPGAAGDADRGRRRTGPG